MQQLKHVCLYFTCRTTQQGHYRFFNTPQKSEIKSSYQKKIIAKFSYPKKSRNQKFQTQKNPSIIPQPRPQGLLLDDFQNGGSTGEDPGKGWNHVVQNLQKSWRFLSRDILRKAKTKWRRRGSKTPVKRRFNFVHEAAVDS